MNREKLRCLIEALEKILHLLNGEFAVQREVDPFAAHLYLSRREYRTALEHPQSLQAVEIIKRGYGHARKLGFAGSEEDWLTLLKIPGAPSPCDAKRVNNHLYGI